MKLREVRYLSADIKHRLPAPGQVIPTPEPNESVVYVPHFPERRRPMARGLLPGGVRSMAAKVVLRHGSQRHKVGSCP